MIQKKCPLATVGLPYCKSDCAWYNPDLLQCAVFGIYDELTGIEGQLSLVSDSIDRLRDIQEDEE